MGAVLDGETDAGKSPQLLLKALRLLAEAMYLMTCWRFWWPLSADAPGPARWDVQLAQHPQPQPLDPKP